jgi:NADPH:quinone reductase
MIAAAIDRFGPPEVLRPRKLPVPGLGPNEVLIAVHAAGIGSWDAAIRSGAYRQGRTRFPVIIGNDGAGVVAAVGSRVRRFAVGQKVYAYSFEAPFGKGGFYAAFVAVDASDVAPIPEGLDMAEAGALAATGLTALQGVDDALHVRKGEVVVVLGATGGVGTLALQFARLRGARVIAVASGRDGAALARRLGADLAIDGRRADPAPAIREFAPEGADALLAFAGGRSLTRCMDALRRGGRVAYPNGVEPAPRKRRGIALASYDAAPGVGEFQRLGHAAEAARLEVPIARTYPLRRAAGAHRRLERGHVLGRLLLHVR